MYLLVLIWCVAHSIFILDSKYYKYYDTFMIWVSYQINFRFSLVQYYDVNINLQQLNFFKDNIY